MAFLWIFLSAACGTNNRNTSTELASGQPSKQPQEIPTPISIVNKIKTKQKPTVKSIDPSLSVNKHAKTVDETEVPAPQEEPPKVITKVKKVNKTKKQEKLSEETAPSTANDGHQSKSIVKTTNNDSLVEQNQKCSAEANPCDGSRYGWVGDYVNGKVAWYCPPPSSNNTIAGTKFSDIYPTQDVVSKSVIDKKVKELTVLKKNPGFITMNASKCCTNDQSSENNNMPILLNQHHRFVTAMLIQLPICFNLKMKQANFWQRFNWEKVKVLQGVDDTIEKFNSELFGSNKK